MISLFPTNGEEACLSSYTNLARRSNRAYIGAGAGMCLLRLLGYDFPE
jgi:hypothetical protein